MRTQSIETNLRLLWRVFWIGLFFNFLIPGGTGGDLIKGYYLTKGRDDQKAQLFGAIIYDRFVGMYGMLAMALLAMFMRPQEIIAQHDLKALFSILAAIWLIFTVFSAVIVYERSRNKLGKDSILQFILIWQWQKKLHEFLINMFRVRTFLVSLFFTFMCQILIVLFLILAGDAAGGENIDRVIYFIVAPVGFMVMAVPIAPGGLGVGQAAFNVLFKIYTGLSSPIMVTAITVYQIITLLISFIGLFYYLCGWDSSSSRSITPARG